jgi:predicted ATPase/DNA-binding SARP family transcriptional activator
VSHLAFFLLGLPRIEREGVPLEFNRRKVIALVSYLAVTGESHCRDVLANLLWPEYDQSAARAALGTTIWALKKALGRDWLDIDRETVSLKRGTSLWVDVDRFRTLLAECRAHGHLVEEVCPACLVPLTKAVELYRDDFLAGFTLRDSTNFDDWQLFQTESLRRDLVNALKKLVRYHSTRGEFEQAIAYAWRWLALDPLHEPAHRYLMKLYAWTGQRAAALHQYRECARALGRELGVSLQKATTRLYRDIKANRLPSPPVIPHFCSLPLCPHNLPAQPVSFLGRERELANIARLLRNPSCRLLTLVGPGGIGKTRLALQAAAENAQIFTHGVCFVPLAPLSSTDLIASTIANLLKFSFHGAAEPKVQILNYLREKEMLLVLDNFEHLLQGAELLVEILSSAPGVKILVTSRESLNLQWEWHLEVRGLRFPQDGKTVAIESYSAVQLFLQSASRVYPDFALSEEEKPAVVRICQFLEGMPLGLELAAAWVQALSCQEIAQEIEHNLGFLTTSLRDVPDRHRSLRAVFDHSWNLLSEEERRVFSKLPVFRGGFRREAAERVADASLSLLSILVRKSFLRRNSNGRYEMLEVLRQYAEEKLWQFPQERDKARDLHCEYYANFLYQREAHLRGEKQREILEEVGEEIENVRAGWQWAVEHGKAEAIDRFLNSLSGFYDVRSWFQEGEEALGKAVKGLGGLAGVMTDSRKDAILGSVLAKQGQFCQKLSRFSKARELLHQSLAIFRRLGAWREVAFSLKELGNVACKLGEYAVAKQMYQESLAICVELGERGGIASCLGNLGVVALMLTEYTEARQLLEEGFAINQELGNRRGMATCLSNLGVVAEGLGEYDEAKQLHQESLAIFKEIDDRWSIANGLNNLGFVICVLGECQESKKCFHKALETAIDTLSVPVALEALVGMVTLLVQEGEKEQASELIDRVLHHPVIYDEIKYRAEQLLSELEPQLLTHALHHSAIYGEIKDRVGEIKRRAEQLLFEPSPRLSLRMVAIAQDSKRMRMIECFPSVMGRAG